MTLSMCIAESSCGQPRPRRGTAWTLLCLLVGVLFQGASEAHPVAQGALELAVFPGHIAVRATVSREEVLVASAMAGKKAADFTDAARRHGDYLLAHLHLAVNGRELQRGTAKLSEPLLGRPSYQLEYRLEGGAALANIELREDVLREFEFAPGNPWEASYLVSIAQEGYPTVEGLLLSFAQPLKFDRQAQGGGILSSGLPAMAWEFAQHGVMHILTGYDHLLFVTALVLAAAGLWDLIKVISAFTLAHTLTLALSALDLFRLPSTIVEPMIAASIVAVAAQNVFWPKSSRGWSRLSAVFMFGLFHGLGFAGGLLEAMANMKSASAALAITAFSFGVEVGHQIVVVPTYFGLRLLRRAAREDAFRHSLRVQRYGSALISVAGMVYLVAALW